MFVLSLDYCWCNLNFLLVLLYYCFSIAYLWCYQFKILSILSRYYFAIVFVTTFGLRSKLLYDYFRTFLWLYIEFEILWKLVTYFSWNRMQMWVCDLVFNSSRIPLSEDFRMYAFKLNMVDILRVVTTSFCDCQCDK